MTLTNTFMEVWAEPGAPGIIDGINPTTGRTFVNDEDEAGVKARYPFAIRMTWQDWREQAIGRQQTPIRWLLTDQASYEYGLEVLPPAIWIGDAFMVGEPQDHDHATGKPRFVAFWKRGGEYLTASRPLTCAEFRAEIRPKGAPCETA